MATENATYIPELDENKPVGASDPVSILDDHDRLIKKTLKNTFGAFVGTAGTPKSVTLTEDEINDAALKSAGATITEAWDFTGDPTVDSVEIGTKRSKIIIDNNAHAFALVESGLTIQKDSGSAANFTIPANSSVAFPTGTIIQGRNRAAADVTIAITTDTLRLIPAGTTGSITVAQYGQFTIQKVATTEWWCTGVNVS